MRCRHQISFLSQIITRLLPCSIWYGILTLSTAATFHWKFVFLVAGDKMIYLRIKKLLGGKYFIRVIHTLCITVSLNGAWFRHWRRNFHAEKANNCLCIGNLDAICVMVTYVPENGLNELRSLSFLEELCNTCHLTAISWVWSSKSWNSYVRCSEPRKHDISTTAEIMKTQPMRKSTKNG